MDTTIKSTNYEMTESVGDYIEERLMAVRKHLGANDAPMRCEVEVGRRAAHSKHGENYFAEVQLVRPGEHIVRAVAEAETVQAAIDIVKDEILAILRKDKTKQSSRLRRVGTRVKEWMRFGRN